MLSKITSWRHSKILAFVLAVAVFLTAFYGLNPVFSLVGAESTTGETATVDIWDGTTPSFADAFGDQIQAGKGTSAETPYEITTGAQLYAALHSDADSFEKYFVVLKDIQLQTDENLEILRDFIAESKNGTSSIDLSGLTKWPATASASGAKSFRGTIDGNHHSITGLYMYSGVTDWGTATGLIDRVQEPTTVKNIILDSAYVSGASYVGGLIGASYGSRAETTISGCTVKNSKIANITGETVEGYAAAGGLIGGGINVGKVTTIDKCVVADTQVTNAVMPDYRGGMVGFMYDNGTSGGGYAVKDSICVGDNISSYYGIFRANLSSNSYAATNAVNLPGVTLLTDTHKGGTAYETMGFIPSKGWIVEDENSCPMYVGVEKAKNSDYVAPIWNGNTALTVENLVGSGTEDNPYLISTGSELYFAVHTDTYSEGKYFVLMNDIQLQTDENLAKLRQFISDEISTVPDGLNNWTSTGKIRFKGNIDGNYHTVTGLYKYASVAASYDSGNAFIDLVNGNRVVKNITLDGAYISGLGKVGGIVGQVYGTGSSVDMSGCTVKNSKIEGRTADSTTYTNGDAGVGGLIGGAHNFSVPSTVENCAVIDTKVISALSTTAHRGGFFGNLWIKSGTTGGYVIKNSFCIGDRIAGIDQRSSVASSNFYATDAGALANTTVLTEAEMKGAVAYDNMPVITPAQGWVAVDGSYPMYVGKDNVEKYEYDIPIWNGKKALTVENLAGLGTGDEPYLISTGSELAAAVRNETDGLVFSIINDIYLNTADSTNNWNLWSSSKVFNGTLNGNGHTIYNMKEIYNSGLDNSTATGSGVSVALIPAAKNATVNNLHIRGSVMAEVWNTHAAALLGVVKTDGTVSINGCSVDNSTVSATRRVSSFVARIEEGATANIENCVSGAGNVFMQRGDSPFVSGGFVGLNSGTANLNNCISAGQALSAEGDGDVIVGENVFTNVANFKEALISGEATISDAFYYDYLSDNAPMLKNRLATQDKDIDGDDDAVLDEADAAALKNILLYGSDAQLTLSEGNANGYNDLAGVDITDLVALYN